MSLDATRLKEAIYQTTKARLHDEFDGLKTDLLAAEQTGFDDSLDKFARAVGYGDGPETVSEITTNGRVTEGILVTLTPAPATITKGLIE